MKTMVIENNIEKIKLYDQSGVDRIFIDLEILGKYERQGHLNTVISKHSIFDVKKASETVKKSDVIVRINPINKNSKEEIDTVISAGADIVMLPMFKTIEEVEKFINFVDKRAKTNLLLETSEAMCRLDEILELPGIDEVHIGLNDLHLSLGIDFMFELFSNGIVEFIVNKIKRTNIPFGIGGVARMDDGTTFSGKPVIWEHVRLGSSMVILSRRFKTFCEEYPTLILKEINSIHQEVQKAKNAPKDELLKNKLLLDSLIKEVVTEIRKQKNV